MQSIEDMLQDMVTNSVPIGKKPCNKSTSRGTISFSDCPNKCVDGFYVDPYKHKRIRCMYCANKRKSVVINNEAINNTENIAELLNLPTSFKGYGDFNIDSIIPPFASKLMDKSSVATVSEVLEDMLNKISSGQCPDYSILFNLGRKTFEANYIYSFLVRSYLSGLITSPYITDYELLLLRNKAEYSQDFDNIEFNDYINSDVCIITITSSATVNSINNVKGLMQLRAHKGHSTIVFTNYWGSYLKTICSEDDVKCKNLAYLYSVDYIKQPIDDEQSSSMVSNPRKPNNGVGLSSKDFYGLMNSQNSL